MQAGLTMIMPLYNTDKELLDRAVKSVLNQTYNNIELLMIDDCSTKKETIDYLNELSEKYKNIDNTGKIVRIVRNPENYGVSKSRNFAILNASKEYLGFIDHDDYLKADFAKRMMESAINNNYDMVICGKEIVNEENKVIGGTQAKDYDNEAFAYFSSMVWTRIYKKETLIEKNLFFPEGCYCEDSVFTVKCTEEIATYGIETFEGYVHFDNTASAGRSKSFYSQKLESIPFDYLLDVCKKMKNKKYAPGNIFEQLTMMTVMIPAGSDKETRLTAMKKAEEYMPYLKSYHRNVRAYIARTPNLLLFKIMSFVQLMALELGFFRIYTSIAQFIIRKKFKL